MPQPILHWQTASAVFFVCVLLVASWMPNLATAARLRVASMGIGGVLLVLLSWLIPAHFVLHGWIVPPVLLLLGYWASGALFVAPMPRAEAVLLGIDRALGIQATAGRMPRAMVEVLEMAYVWVYPLIPVALALLLTVTRAPDVERFWTVLLVTDFVCFGILPWVQTRPPRALEPAEPWTSAVRPFNLRLLGAASIHVNTFPSGHAAEALAAALLLLDAPPAVVAWMTVNAVAISAGAVFGRYHYAADAIAGWAVALGVWLLFG
jgi:hypothetical protein